MMKTYTASEEKLVVKENGEIEFHGVEDKILTSYGTKKHVIQHLKDLSGKTKYASSAGIIAKEQGNSDILVITCEDDDEIVGYLYE